MDINSRFKLLRFACLLIRIPVLGMLLLLIKLGELSEQAFNWCDKTIPGLNKNDTYG